MRLETRETLRQQVRAIITDCERRIEHVESHNRQRAKGEPGWSPLDCDFERVALAKALLAWQALEDRDAEQLAKLLVELLVYTQGEIERRRASSPGG